MSCGDEIKSGSFALYGQWAALISIVLLIALGVQCLFSNIGLLAFAIPGWIFAAIMIFLECPLCLKCCPISERATNFLKFFQKLVLRVFLYFIFAAVMWLSLLMSSSSLIACAVGLTFTFLFYGIATLKGEEYKSSKIAGGAGVEAGVVYRV